VGTAQKQRSVVFVAAAETLSMSVPACLDIDSLEIVLGLCGTIRGMVACYEAAIVVELESRVGEHQTTETLKKKQKISPRKAKRRRKSAENTAKRPEVAAALANGEISEEHADTIADAEQAHPGAGASLALLDNAKSQGVEAFRHSTRDWRRGQDGDEGETEAEKQFAARNVKTHVRPEDGMGVTIAELDPENHATLIGVLAYWVRRLRNKALNTEPDPLADQALVSTTPAQLLADALVAMASASINGHDGPTVSAAGVARMLVICDFDVLTQQLTGKLADGTVLSPSTIRRLACDAEILPAVFGSDGQPLDLGRGERTASQGQRVLLIARDGGCRGCGARPEFCQAHHIWHWSHGGPTNINNLVLLCNRCHHLVHEGGHTVHKKTDGTYTIIAPNRTQRRQTPGSNTAPNTRPPNARTSKTRGAPDPTPGTGGPNAPGAPPPTSRTNGPDPETIEPDPSATSRPHPGTGASNSRDANRSGPGAAESAAAFSDTISPSPTTPWANGSPRQTGRGSETSGGPFDTPANDQHETETDVPDREYPPKARDQNDADDPTNPDPTPPTSRAPNQPRPNSGKERHCEQRLADQQISAKQIAEQCLNQARQSIANANPTLDLFNTA